MNRGRETLGGNALVTHDPVFAAMARKVLRLVDEALEQALAFNEDDAARAAGERGLAG